jgi:hypothetical protein
MAEQPKPKTPVREEIPAMFKDSFFVAGKGGKRKAVALPIALFLHTILVAVLIVAPLLSTSNLPKIEITSAFLAPPPPPPPPPPPTTDSEQAKANELWAEVLRLQGEGKFIQAYEKALQVQAMPEKYHPQGFDDKLKFLKQQADEQRKVEFFGAP